MTWSKSQDLHERYGLRLFSKRSIGNGKFHREATAHDSIVFHNSNKTCKLEEMTSSAEGNVGSHHSPVKWDNLPLRCITTVSNIIIPSQLPISYLPPFIICLCILA